MMTKTNLLVEGRRKKRRWKRRRTRGKEEGLVEWGEPALLMCVDWANESGRGPVRRWTVGAMETGAVVLCWACAEPQGTLIVYKGVKEFGQSFSIDRSRSIFKLVIVTLDRLDAVYSTVPAKGIKGKNCWKLSGWKIGVGNPGDRCPRPIYRATDHKRYLGTKTFSLSTYLLIIDVLFLLPVVNVLCYQSRHSSRIDYSPRLIGRLSNIPGSCQRSSARQKILDAWERIISGAP
jgi:hypothetical protein